MIDWELVQELAHIQCTQNEISSAVSVLVDTLHRHDAISACVHWICANFCTSSQSITIFGLPALPFSLTASTIIVGLTSGMRLHRL